jgi:predicted nucleic acid-binding protein
MGLKFLLDTATVIAAVQGRLPVVLQLGRCKPQEVAVSVFSQIEAEASLQRGARLEPGFTRLLKELFAAVKLLEFSAADAQAVLTLSPYLPSGTARITSTELYLAATALRHNLLLITPTPERYALLPDVKAEAWR